MRPIKLTNREVNEIISNLRTSLKQTRSASGKLNITFDLSAIKDAPKADLYIMPEAYYKITQLVQQCDKEVGWHGTVHRENNQFYIDDIFVFPQDVTSATVQSDDAEYIAWLYQLPDDVFNKLRFHGHSHVNMGVTPSGVDTTYQDNMLANLTDFYIFGIFNKREANWLVIYDFENNIVYEDKDIVLHLPNTDAKMWAKEQLKQYVRTPKPTYGKYTGRAKHVTPAAAPQQMSLTDEIMQDYYNRISNPYSL